MGKKIKISEAQLMRLMEMKNKQMNEEEVMNELMTGAVEQEMAEQIAPKVAEMLASQSNDWENMDLGIFARSLVHHLTQIARKQKNAESEMKDMDEMDQMDELEMETNEVDSLAFPESEIEADEMLSESVKGIRTEFDRYMKGPKI